MNLEKKWPVIQFTLYKLLDLDLMYYTLHLSLIYLIYKTETTLKSIS